MESLWSGRNDGDTPEHRRWHQHVTPLTTGASPGIALIGYAVDEGVRRNHGRTGAATGPSAIRRALAPLALHLTSPIHDAGDITLTGQDLEGAQRALGESVAALLDQQHLVIALGGGHDIAWGTYLGRRSSNRLRAAQTAVINLDAHFDLRRAGQPTSGTPFLQMADAEAIAGRRFDYSVLGISRTANTRALFESAAQLGVNYLLDVQCAPRHLDRVAESVSEILSRNDAIHLSIDLDVLPAATAPGVSAPAAYGVALETVEAICHQVASSGRLALVDVAELNPNFDIDGRTARVAARLIDTICRASES
ncbi:MAG TPA: formimidoylglutamase [Marmoricola sp.]|nr:formimidoylglutamase [Marmoricola sp.]HNN47610.1 formimidoylglutamase [Marmoricola sp.]HNO40069.1 formimidoylglutamase [Marmoricola sp.]